MTLEEFHRTFDDLAAGVALLDSRRHILAVNPAYCRLTGSAPPVGQACGSCHRCWEYRPQGERPVDLCQTQCPFDRPKALAVPLPVVLEVPEGGTIPVQRAYSRLLRPDGSLEALLLFFFPIVELDRWLRKSRRELGRLGLELSLASEVQREMLQLRRETSSGWEIGLSSRQYRPVGGDLAETSQNVLYLADVSGKSMPAALTLQAVSQAFQESLTGEPSLAMDSLNKRMCRLLPPAMFVAASVLFTGPDGLQLLHAGLEQPWVYRSRERLSHPLPCQGLVLGVEERARHIPQAVEMEAGDLLAVWSDGLGEALERAGADPAGMVARLAAAPAGELDEATRRELAGWTLKDDASLLTIRRDALERDAGAESRV